jgi:hypothetical protein
MLLLKCKFLIIIPCLVVYSMFDEITQFFRENSWADLANTIECGATDRKNVVLEAA